MKKSPLSLRCVLQEMITTNLGTISSKVIIGAITYVLVALALVVVMFVNPEFSGLPELLSVLMITSASLLGLTTIENIKNKIHHPMEKLKTKLCTEGAIETSLEEKDPQDNVYNPLNP